MSSLPKLTLSDLQRYFHAAYFERGLNYYDRGNIFNPIRRGNTLEARCIGSMPNPYRVRSTLSATVIDSTDCSCPIGGGCKHAAALLLTWVHKPEAFTAHQPFVDLLIKRSKEDLIFLIQEMIKRDPDLEMLRPKLLASLTKNRHFDVLARIHLYEENWDAAWDAATPRESRYQSTYIQEEVAQATEQHRPQRAIKFYLSRAEQLIAQRGRKNYAAASQYLQLMHNLSKSIDRMESWQQTIAAPRENHRNLPALQDELDKAGL
jgi:uncharacterized Zn finger protein